MQVTLDILCLTLPREPESLSLTETPQSVPVQQQHQTGLSTPTTPVQLQQQLSNMSHTSFGSMDERLSADQLGHLPDYQQRAVNKLVLELRWLMRDEVRLRLFKGISFFSDTGLTLLLSDSNRYFTQNKSSQIAACALDDWPVTESTLSMVAEHISGSLGRSTCLLETVPLHFVYETGKCLAKFLEALADLRVNGYRMQAEGSTFYMVKDTAKDAKDSCVTPCDASEAGWDVAEAEVEAASTPVMPRVATESTIEQSTDGSGSARDSVYTVHQGPGFGHGLQQGHGHGEETMLTTPMTMMLNPDSDLCNWSEAAARHSEVSSLLESALGTEDGRVKLCLSSFF